MWPNCPNGYPYTDLHRLNLDWVMQQTAQNTQDIQELKNQELASMGPIIDITTPPDGLKPCAADGVTDDTGALTAILQYAATNNRPVYIRGTVAVSSTINMPVTSYIMGLAPDPTNTDVSLPLSKAPSAIKYIGPATRAVLSWSGISTTHVENLAVDANNAAEVGLFLDNMTSSYFANVSVNLATTGYSLVPTTHYAQPDRGCQFNTFVNCSAIMCSTGFVLDAPPNFTANACHNVFINTMITYTGDGIYMGDCDNNTFLETFCYGRPEASGYGVVMAAKARDNYIIHHQGTAHSLSGSKNAILFFSTENGQPEPVIDQGAYLLVTSNFNNSFGWNMASTLIDNVYFKMLRGVSSTAIGVSSDTANSVLIYGPDSNSIGMALSRDGSNYSGPSLRFAYGDGTTQDGVTFINRSHMQSGRLILSSASNMSPTFDGDIVLESNPTIYIGKVRVNGEWKNFGKIE